MTEETDHVENIQFFDTVDNLIDGATNFDFSEEMSTDTTDVYELRDGLTSFLLVIDYDEESITVLRRFGNTDEVVRSFTDEDFCPSLTADIVAVTYQAMFPGRYR